MQVVILHESLTGNTERAARLIANAFYDRQVGAHVFPVDGYDAEAVADADLVVVGTWTDGFFLVAQKPAKRKKFRALPDLSGKRCAVFCTFALDSGHTLDKLSAVMTERRCRGHRRSGHRPRSARPGCRRLRRPCARRRLRLATSRVRSDVVRPSSGVGGRQ